LGQQSWQQRTAGTFQGCLFDFSGKSDTQKSEQMNKVQTNFLSEKVQWDLLLLVLVYS
jgi:hypothetical protein